MPHPQLSGLQSSELFYQPGPPGTGLQFLGHWHLAGGFGSLSNSPQTCTHSKGEAPGMLDALGSSGPRLLGALFQKAIKALDPHTTKWLAHTQVSHHFRNKTPTSPQTPQAASGEAETQRGKRLGQDHMGPVPEPGGYSSLRLFIPILKEAHLARRQGRLHTLADTEGNH